MYDSNPPWWAEPDAAVRKAGIANDGTRCPICGELDTSGELELYFPAQAGPILGFILTCGHVIEAEVYDLAVAKDDQIDSGFFVTPIGHGTYPVTIVDQTTGNADLIALPVIDSSDPGR